MATITPSDTNHKVPCAQLFSPFNNFISRFGPPHTNAVSKNTDDGFDKLTIDKGLTWFKTNDGSPIVLTAKFIGKPSTRQPDVTIGKIKAAAMIWETFANIKFKWVGDNEDATIRCGFISRSGHWSYVGRDNDLIPKEKNTMNLEFYDRDDDNEIRGTTLHEFGHAIGCIHEQVNPKIGQQFTWNTAVMYKYFEETYGWDKDKVNKNYNSFQTITDPNVVSTNWDKFSIMQYAIEPGWTNPSMTVGRNQNLTDFDKQFIGDIYGKPKK